MAGPTISGSIAALRSELEVVVADTPALVREAQELRHQVYCTERGYEVCGGGAEVCAHDVHSAHVLLRRRDGGGAVGTARLVLAVPGRGADSYPMAAVARAAFDGVPLATTAEVSRFSVSKERRGVSGEAAALARLALVRGLVLLTRAEGVTHWAAVMEPTLLRLLRSSGIHFDRAGPMVEYHGVRQPCVREVPALLGQMRAERPEVWAFVTDDGALTRPAEAPGRRRAA